jgi:hypothetical protein
MSIATEWDERLRERERPPSVPDGVPLQREVFVAVADLRALVDAALELERLRPSWLPKGDPEVDRRLDQAFAEQERDVPRKKILSAEAIRRAEFERTRERCADILREESDSPTGRYRGLARTMEAIRALPFEEKP